MQRKIENIRKAKAPSHNEVELLLIGSISLSAVAVNFVITLDFDSREPPGLLKNRIVPKNRKKVSI
ncbi:hypothetical protein BXO88_05715 [Oribacterium sp. C9]|nr:hypothetical protein BXO88_05715 [Oribacterium sp. C9]